MKRKSFWLIVLLAISPQVKLHAQWAVFDPTNLSQSIVNTTRQIVQTSSTATNMINNFKETVKIYEQGKQYYDALKSVNNLVKDAKKVQQTMLLVGEISDIYIHSFQKMLSDPHYTLQELNAISFGYAKLLGESADLLQELKNIVNTNGLSMSDSERLNLINSTYENVKKHRDLVNYYTKKTISVSYLRAKKAGDTDRVMALYGNANEKYW